MTRPTMASIAMNIALSWPVDPGAEPITVRDIRGPSKGRREVRPRQSFMAAARTAGFTTTQIGIYLGGRDHTAAIYGARRHAEREGVAA